MENAPYDHYLRSFVHAAVATNVVVVVVATVAQQYF